MMKIEDEKLEMVNGGTFDINSYSEETYNQIGIRTNYHFWDKDEFWLMSVSGNWVPISYSEANEAVKLYYGYKWTLPKLTYERYTELKLEFVNHRDRFYNRI